jgi:FAD:protein FMN transferase
LLDPFVDGGEVARIRMDSGAVATTARTCRRWSQQGEEQHHLIDPGTGHPSYSGLAAVSIVCGEGWWAEVLATASFVVGLRRDLVLVEAAGAGGLFITDDGDVVLAGDIGRFLL